MSSVLIGRADLWMDKYVVYDEIGHGRHSAVFKARHLVSPTQRIMTKLAGGFELTAWGLHSWTQSTPDSLRFGVLSSFQIETVTDRQDIIAVDVRGHDRSDEELFNWLHQSIGPRSC